MEKNKIVYLILLSLSLGVFIPRSPCILQIPGGDSGVFLYSAWRMLQGDTLYKNIWDHKPPLIHFINVVGLLLSNNTMWGIWIIQIVFLTASVICCFALLKKYFGCRSALITSFLGIISFAYLINEGNFPQEYILTFQFLSLFLLLRKSSDQIITWDTFNIGVCGSFSFLLQPNAIGMWIFIFLILVYWCYKDKRHCWHLIGFLIGICTPLLIVITYFYFNNSLYDLYDQIIRYNYYYSVISATNRLLTIYVGFLFYLLSGIIVFALYGYVYTLINFLKKTENNSILLQYAIFGSIIEVILTSLSGRYSSNYYITWLPFLTILSCYAFSHFSKIMPKITYISFLTFILISNVTIVSYYSYLQIKKQLKYNETYTPLIKWMAAHTTPSDTILFWGHDVRYLFLTKRKTPTRFSYQYALFTKGYASNKIVNEYYRDLKNNHPKYIIEIQATFNFIEPYSSHSKKIWSSIWPTYQSIRSMQKVYDYLGKQYKMEVSTTHWKIYKTKYSQ